MIFKIDLPLPPKQIGGNARGHSRQHAPWIAAYRLACNNLYRQAKIGPLPTPITLELEFFLGPLTDARGQKLPDNLYRPRDDDDAIRAFKAGRDALVDAGIVPNDSKQYVIQSRAFIYSKKSEHKGARKIVLTIKTPDEK